MPPASQVTRSVPLRPTVLFRIQEERALAEMVDRGGRDPRALLVDAEHVAGEIGAESARRTHASGHGHELAVLIQDTTPAAPRRLVVRVVAHVEVEGDPELAQSVALGSVGVTMIGAGDIPASAGGEVFVGDAVAVRVAQTRGFGALGHKEVLAFPQ